MRRRLPRNAIKLRLYPRASTSPFRGYAQHERCFSAYPARSGVKSKDKRDVNLMPLDYHEVASVCTCAMTLFVAINCGAIPGDEHPTGRDSNVL